MFDAKNVDHVSVKLQVRLKVINIHLSNRAKVFPIIVINKFVARGTLRSRQNRLEITLLEQTLTLPVAVWCAVYLRRCQVARHWRVTARHLVTRSTPNTQRARQSARFDFPLFLAIFVFIYLPRSLISRVRRVSALAIFADPVAVNIIGKWKSPGRE